MLLIVLLFVISHICVLNCLMRTHNNNTPSLNTRMMYGDSTRRGVPFSKDPHVIRFHGKYLMYYSVPPYSDDSHPVKGWGIGIAESNDLIDWKKIGEILPQQVYEQKGLCAPCALVIHSKVHLFYQTYGNGCRDAICHASSENGIDFIRNPTNPIFHPEGNWTCGRAIDAEVIKFKNQYLLYYATRDSTQQVQLLGVAAAPLNTNFNADDWTQLTDDAILKPELPWEKRCIEGASVIQRGDILYMFYAGAFNNEPQQIGVAQSRDGIKWTRLSDQPFLPNGDPGEWNSSESGHPHILRDRNGKTYLFFQGNNDHGKTWYISKHEVVWNKNGPHILKK
ncbi:family 43 glycosylhydrolase [candidate division KSB1 bacterium]|nr:family 43 glycosylhydrolase [candidate division KSB1 bacterium]